MTDKLYLIGNGFDIHHGLKTSYADFRDNFAKKSPYLWGLLSDIYGDAIYNNMWWSCFEEMLGKIDYLHLMNSKNGNALGFQKTKNLLRGTLPPLFGRWIKKINANVEVDSALGIDTDSKFFSFNYTLLLENSYGVKEENVWHIHNSVHEPDDIIVGHDSDNTALFMRLCKYKEDNPNEYFNPAFTNYVNQEIANGAKKVKEIIAQNGEKFYELYSGIKHYIAMGFSFNDIDMPYIEEIIKVNSKISDADWTLYYHSDNEEVQMIERLMKLGIKRINIKDPKWW